MSLLCNLYDRLSDYRGKVNDKRWGSLLYCQTLPPEAESFSDPMQCLFFPKEMFCLLTGKKICHEERTGLRVASIAT